MSTSSRWRSGLGFEDRISIGSGGSGLGVLGGLDAVPMHGLLSAQASANQRLSTMIPMLPAAQLNKT